MLAPEFNSIIGRSLGWIFAYDFWPAAGMVGLYPLPSACGFGWGRGEWRAAIVTIDWFLTKESLGKQYPGKVRLS